MVQEFFSCFLESFDSVAVNRVVNNSYQAIHNGLIGQFLLLKLVFQPLKVCGILFVLHFKGFYSLLHINSRCEYILDSLNTLRYEHDCAQY